MPISNLIEEKKELFKNFQKKHDLNFQDENLLIHAFIHTSYTNENNIDVLESYERLEFLGDAVLKLSISKILYEQYPEYKEGELTKLRAEIVSDRNIFEYAKKLGFEDLIILGKNEKKHGGSKKESILACAFEAFLGAIFLEYKEEGLNKAYKFLKDNFLDEILDTNNKISLLSPKTLLQEYTQSINKQLPIYSLIKEEGKEHDKNFYVDVIFNNETIGQGCAKSLKKAQQEAANDALIKLGIIKQGK